jgi:glycyl-tRNA synthetase beta chain
MISTQATAQPTTHATATAPLLVELFTEELPPKALERLGDAFAAGIEKELAAKGLLAKGNRVTAFATPRRLAAHLSAVLSTAPNQPFTEKLMPVKVGLDADGNPTAALLKKLESKGLGHLLASDLEQVDDGKQAYLIARGMAPGADLTPALQAALQTSVEGLPIPKVMRYQLADGKTSVNFVRPAHGLVALHGETVIDVTLLGLAADRQTGGHRFLSTEPIAIQSADSYEQQLTDQGQVTASFKTRRATIEAGLVAKAHELGATLGEDPAVGALLDEVTALVEAPAIYVGEFEPRFLDVPQECLILTMRLNQKYFPLFEPQSGKLTHRFLIVSNMPIKDPSAIIVGNERVIRPRLADAEFFFLTDKKQALVDRVAALESIVYHNKLGTQRVRVERIRQVCDWLARALGADPEDSMRAALMAKADLTTQMVGEFPELQGIMGSYYARANGEPEPVVKAIARQYQTRWSDPIAPEDLAGVVLYMAERAETLVGIWGIGLAPTGERDPFGLRRAALGLISGFEHLRDAGYLALAGTSTLSLEGLLEAARSTFQDNLNLDPQTVLEVDRFVRERYRNQLIANHPREAVEAVFALSPALQQVAARVEAVEGFMRTAEAPSLAAANKRIGNLLKKADNWVGEIDANSLTEAAERQLFESLQAVAPAVAQHMSDASYGQALNLLAGLRAVVDQFFDDVMVMADDPVIRRNRLTLLAKLHGLMNQVADISRLAT